MTEERRSRPGRPAHEPTDESRALVVAMVGQGKTLAEIAAMLEISEPTLSAHYADELLTERPQLNFSFAKIEPGKRPRKSNRLGRPEHVPTFASRNRVEIMVAGNMRQWQIAAALGISVPTLCQHYMPQLENGRARKRAKVLEALFNAAVKDGNVAAQKAWLAQPDELEHAPPAPKEAPMGKKEEAIIAAGHAGAGTEWEGLLPN